MTCCPSSKFTLKGERILDQEPLHYEHFSASQTCLKGPVHGFLKNHYLEPNQYASQNYCPAMNSVVTTFFPLSATHLSKSITQKTCSSANSHLMLRSIIPRILSWSNLLYDQYSTTLCLNKASFLASSFCLILAQSRKDNE